MTPVTQNFTVSLNVTGLSVGSTAMFQNNSGDDLNVNSNRISSFSMNINDTEAYNVTVSTQPTSPNQTCVVTSPMGNISGSNVTLDVACTVNQYNVDVNVTGLAATNSVIVSNGVDSQTFNADGTQTISTLNDESSYDVSITSQPDTPNQVCSFTNTNMGTLAGADATINVECVTTQYSVILDVSGLAAGNSAVFQNNGGDDLSVISDGNATFATSMDDGTSWNITVLTQPTAPNQTCVVNTPTGNLNGSNMVLPVLCTTETYFVGGIVNGLLNNSMVVLQNNMQDNKIITCNGPFVFNTPLDDLSSYAATIFSQPQSPMGDCALTQESGTVSGEDVITIELTCEYTTAGDYLFKDGFEASLLCQPAG